MVVDFKDIGALVVFFSCMILWGLGLDGEVKALAGVAGGYFLTKAPKLK